MTAIQFLTYCAGISSVIVSLGAAIRLGRCPSTPLARAEQSLVEQAEPAVDVLAARMQALQQARYASPIVQRVLTRDAMPVRRSARSQTPATPVPVGERIPKKEG